MPSHALRAIRHRGHWRTKTPRCAPCLGDAIWIGEGEQHAAAFDIDLRAIAAGKFQPPYCKGFTVLRALAFVVLKSRKRARRSGSRPPSPGSESNRAMSAAV
jgi:hypothetical protein